MKLWKHPTLGPIDVLPKRVQTKKVWKHFFDINERWDRLCNADIDKSCRTVEEFVGVSRESTSDLAQIPSRARSLLLRCHDELYGPTYQAQMAHPDTVWTENMDRIFRHQALTPDSVFVVVELNRDKPNCVVTAYRPQPGYINVNRDERAFRRYAEKYFTRKTGMNSFTRITVENLNEASTSVPETVHDLWFLASAIGYGRALPGNTDLGDTLAIAEGVLSQTPPNLLADLAATLAWDRSLDDIAEGLKDDRPEALEHALMTFEEVVAVAVGLGEGERAWRYSHDAALLLAWLPAEWLHLMHTATSRLESFAESDSPIVQIWAAVESAAIGASLREAPAQTQPTARYTNALLGPTKWSSWRDRISTASQSVVGLVESWVGEALDSLEIVSPVPSLSSSKSAHDVRCIVPDDAPHYRVFVIDDDYPKGLEVTQFVDADGSIWKLETDNALLVLAASTDQIDGDSLDDLLERAGSNKSVFIEWRELTQPK